MLLKIQRSLPGDSAGLQRGNKRGQLLITTMFDFDKYQKQKEEHFKFLIKTWEKLFYEPLTIPTKLRKMWYFQEKYNKIKKRNQNLEPDWEENMREDNE